MLPVALAGFLSFSLGAAPSVPAPYVEWQQSYGGNFGEYNPSIRETFDGGYILCGTSSSPPFGNKTTPHFGVTDLWVLRLDGDGQILWQKTFGGDEQEGPHCAIRQTSNGGFIVTTVSRSGISGNKTTPLLGRPGDFDLWVVRLDNDGELVWQASFGGVGWEFFATSLQETSDGGFILGCTSNSGASGNKSSPNYGNDDYWLVRLDRNGAKLWDQTFGGTRDDRLHAVQQTADGGFILGGESWSAVSGNKTSPNFGPTNSAGADFWVIRVDPDGNKLWEKSYGGSSWDFLYSLAQTSDGGFAFGGYSYSGASGNKTSTNFGIIDFWVVRTDASGEILWDKAYGGGGVSILYSLQTTFDGGFILGGHSDETFAGGRVGNKTSPSFGGGDYWIVRTDERGNSLWQLSFGGSGSELLYDVQQTSDGGFIVGGESRSSADGNKTSIVYGGEDYWVVKLAPEDLDADGVLDLRDLCPNTPPGDVVNDAGCSIGQLVPCDGPWQNHGEYVQAITEISADFLRAGLISREQRSAIIHQAVKSDCGEPFKKTGLRPDK